MAQLDRRSAALFFIALSFPLAVLAYFAHWVFGFFALLSLLAAFAFFHQQSHVLNAAVGLDAGTRVDGSVRLYREHDSDRYVVDVHSDANAHWRFSCPTDGWTPVEGEAYPAKLCFINEVRWPVLVITEHALLWGAPEPLWRPATHPDHEPWWRRFF